MILCRWDETEEKLSRLLCEFGILLYIIRESRKLRVNVDKSENQLYFVRLEECHTKKN